MKYPARFYAQALASLIEDGQIKKQEEVVNNLLSVLKKHGDLKQLSTIIRLTERALVEKDGGREVIIETARPIKNIQEKIHSLINAHDIVHEEVNPALLAGVRITVNGETQIDASLRSQLDRLFAVHPTL